MDKCYKCGEKDVKSYYHGKPYCSECYPKQKKKPSGPIYCEGCHRMIRKGRFCEPCWREYNKAHCQTPEYKARRKLVRDRNKKKKEGASKNIIELKDLKIDNKSNNTYNTNKTISQDITPLKNLFLGSGKKELNRWEKKVYNREYRNRPDVKERAKIYGREYFKTNIDIIREKEKKYRDRPEVKAMRKEKRKQYYKKNRVEMLRKRKKYYRMNREKMKQYARGYREKKRGEAKVLPLYSSEN